MVGDKYGDMFLYPDWNLITSVGNAGVVDQAFSRLVHDFIHDEGVSVTRHPHRPSAYCIWLNEEHFVDHFGFSEMELSQDIKSFADRVCLRKLDYVTDQWTVLEHWSGDESHGMIFPIEWQNVARALVVTVAGKGRVNKNYLVKNQEGEEIVIVYPKILDISPAFDFETLLY